MCIENDGAGRDEMAAMWRNSLQGKLRDAQAEIVRLKAELEKSDGEYDTLVQESRKLAAKCDSLNEKLGAWMGMAGKAEARYTEALARVAAAAMEMRERAAEDAYYRHRDKLPAHIKSVEREHILALPIDPDAQKALDQLLAKAREDGIREAASIIKYACHDDMTRDEEAGAIYALLNNGGQNE